MTRRVFPALQVRQTTTTHQPTSALPTNGKSEEFRACYREPFSYIARRSCILVSRQQGSARSERLMGYSCSRFVNVEQRLFLCRSETLSPLLFSTVSSTQQQHVAYQSPISLHFRGTTDQYDSVWGRFVSAVLVAGIRARLSYPLSCKIPSHNASRSIRLAISAHIVLHKVSSATVSCMMSRPPTSRKSLEPHCCHSAGLHK